MIFRLQGLAIKHIIEFFGKDSKHKVTETLATHGVHRKDRMPLADFTFQVFLDIQTHLIPRSDLERLFNSIAKDGTSEKRLLSAEDFRKFHTEVCWRGWGGSLFLTTLVIIMSSCAIIDTAPARCAPQRDS